MYTNETLIVSILSVHLFLILDLFHSSIEGGRLLHFDFTVHWSRKKLKILIAMQTERDICDTCSSATTTE